MAAQQQRWRRPWSDERRITEWGRSKPSLAAVSEDLWLVYEREGDIWYRTSMDSGTPGRTRRSSHASSGGRLRASGGRAGIRQRRRRLASDRSGNPDIWFGIPGEREDINPPPYIE